MLMVVVKRLELRRKREGRTNYKKRLALLKSGKPRLVIRRSNRYLLLQVVAYHPDGDNVLTTTSSRSLAKKGWKGSGKSLPAAYLTGLLLAKQALEKGVEEVIVDIGLQKHRAGTRLCAAIKGVIDGGVRVPADESIFPPQERLFGEHISPELTLEARALAERLAPRGARPQRLGESPARSRSGGGPATKKGGEKGASRVEGGESEKREES